jgi:hypothetical protein
MIRGNISRAYKQVGHPSAYSGINSVHRQFKREKV